MAVGKGIVAARGDLEFWPSRLLHMQPGAVVGDGEDAAQSQLVRAGI